MCVLSPPTRVRRSALPLLCVLSPPTRVRRSALPLRPQRPPVGRPRCPQRLLPAAAALSPTVPLVDVPGADAAGARSCQVRWRNPPSCPPLRSHPSSSSRLLLPAGGRPTHGPSWQTTAYGRTRAPRPQPRTRTRRPSQRTPNATCSSQVGGSVGGPNGSGAAWGHSRVNLEPHLRARYGARAHLSGQSTSIPTPLAGSLTSPSILILPSRVEQRPRVSLEAWRDELPRHLPAHARVQRARLACVEADQPGAEHARPDAGGWVGRMGEGET